MGKLNYTSFWYKDPLLMNKRTKWAIGLKTLQKSSHWHCPKPEHECLYQPKRIFSVQMTSVLLFIYLRVYFLLYKIF